MVCAYADIADQTLRLPIAQRPDVLPGPTDTVQLDQIDLADPQPLQCSLQRPHVQKKVWFDLGRDEDARAQACLGEDLAQNALGNAVRAGVGSGVNDTGVPCQRGRGLPR